MDDTLARMRSKLPPDIRAAMEDLDRIIRESHGGSELTTLARTTRFMLLAAAGSLGECRVTTPFAPLRPVIDSHGNFRWCCTHDPEHCAS